MDNKRPLSFSVCPCKLGLRLLHKRLQEKRALQLPVLFLVTLAFRNAAIT